MPDPICSYTLNYGIVLNRGNNYGQSYCTSYGWSRCHPMVHKREVCYTLSLMLKFDGVPPKMIVDKSKEQSLGAFTRKCREFECHIVNKKLYSPWSHMDEGCIWYHKQELSRQLIKTVFPNILWDHCIELKSLTLSHTAHSNYELDGKVPDTCINGQTADISNICRYYL